MKECDKIRDLFGPYIYGSITPAERAAVEEHVDRCEKCADDLRSRQKVLGKLEPRSQLGDMPQRAQDDFAWNVYRRIALDALRRRSRQIFLQRFVLQPSLAALVLAAGIGIGVLRFHSSPVMVREPSSVARTDDMSKKELRAAMYEEEFFRRQGTAYEREPAYALPSRASTTKRPSSGMSYLTLLNDSGHLLEDANFINYSLGDPRRALPKYQWLIDYHPGTDEAMEARRIIEAEYGTQAETIDAEQTADIGI